VACRACSDKDGTKHIPTKVTPINYRPYPTPTRPKYRNRGRPHRTGLKLGKEFARYGRDVFDAGQRAAPEELWSGILHPSCVSLGLCGQTNAVLSSLFCFLLFPSSLHLNYIIPQFVLSPFCSDTFFVRQHAAIDIPRMGRSETLGELGHLVWPNSTV